MDPVHVAGGGRSESSGRAASHPSQGADGLRAAGRDRGGAARRAPLGARRLAHAPAHLPLDVHRPPAPHPQQLEQNSRALLHRLRGSPPRPPPHLQRLRGLHSLLLGPRGVLDLQRHRWWRARAVSRVRLARVALVPTGIASALHWRFLRDVRPHNSLRFPSQTRREHGLIPALVRISC